MVERATVADTIVEILFDAGVREVYSVVGGAMTPLLRAINAKEGIDYVGVRHEFAAAAMAAATFQGFGRVAVCLGEQGPGTLNLISGLGIARNNRLPVIALTVSGHSRTAGPGSGALMELDATLASQAVTKWQYAVRSPDEVAAAVREAVRQSTATCPGPVHVDVPRDIVGALAGEDDAPEHRAPAVTHEALDQALRILTTARRPLVIAGGGAAHARAEEALGAVAAHLGAVTTTTQMGIGVLPSNGALFAGQGGVIAGPALIRAVQEADVVLAVGCRFSSWWWRDGQRLVQDAAIVQIDTDAAVIERTAAHGLVGDARAVLDRLWCALRDGPALPVSAWARGVRADFISYRARLEALAEERQAPAHPAALARELADLVSPDDRVVLDGGHTTFWSNDFIAARRPRTVFHDPGMGHLGFGIPYANALALADRSRRVVTITGDGAFGFSVAELDTARRLGLRTITVIHNNASWGVIGLAQMHAGFTLGTDLSGTDYAAIANGFGCLGLRVDDIADLARTWDKALASELPVVLDVVVRFEPHPMMPEFGRTTASPSAAIP